MKQNNKQVLFQSVYRSILAELSVLDRLYVNAFINNISFPTSIEELECFVYKHGQYHLEDILFSSDTNWTVPRNAKIGDIVLYFHAKTAISRITALITKVKNLSDHSEHDKELLLADMVIKLIDLDDVYDMNDMIKRFC